MTVYRVREQLQDSLLQSNVTLGSTWSQRRAKGGKAVFREKIGIWRKLKMQLNTLSNFCRFEISDNKYLDIICSKMFLLYRTTD
jgi:hypothetical protein